ncbi:MAG: hypothetical protein DRJ01_01325 [Bacteroidetes bacterium]|nr:MAG: hypothetical protein DRJ01_01325 [Bacteroidota bacterium]
MNCKISNKYQILFFLFISLFFNYNLKSQIIRGNNNVVTKERDVSDFSGVSISGIFDVFISQGDKEELKIETDDNIQQYIITEVRKGILNIQLTGNVKRLKTLNVYVTVKKLNSLIILGGNHVTISSVITTDNIEVYLGGESTLTFNVLAKEMECDITDAGIANFNGKVDVLNIRISDDAELNAFDMNALTCKLKASGFSQAKINVIDKLDMIVTGDCNVYYKGSPEINNRVFSGGGFIIKRNQDVE